MKLDKFQKQAFFCTIRITSSKESEPGYSIGTGFIFHANLIGTHGLMFLVSNRHVINDPQSKIMLNFHLRKQDSFKPDIGKIFRIETTDFSDAYYTLPNSDIDLACINISRITDPKHNVYFNTIHAEMYSNYSEADLIPGMEVYFVGYPQGLYDREHNLPILRRGYIASIPEIDYEGRKVFLIDAQIFQGSSGSPVFTVINNKFTLIGVLSGSLVVKEGIKPISSQIQLGVYQPLGLGVVIKSACLHELINYAVQETKRKRNSNKDSK